MKLFFAPPSPFVRKVRVLAHEIGLIDRIEHVDVALTPIASDQALNAENPLGKIPCLVTDDGMALYDSRVACEYLDTLHDGPKMFPAEGGNRWRALTRQALCDGLLDAAVITRYETFLRPEALQWREWIDAQLGKVRRALDQLEAAAPAPGCAPDIGAIAAGVACGYVDFRYPDEGWRDSRPRLAAWYEKFAARESMVATRPG